MKRLLLIGTIAALAFTTTGEARTLKEKRVVRHVTTTQSVNGTTTTVAPVANRTVVRRYSNGGGYYYGPSYSGYYPYYSSGPAISVGFGGAYGYPGYGYGYGYPYGYSSGYPYGYNGYGYNGDYPYTTTTYTTTNHAYYYSDNMVARVQARLADAGYYHGVIDGVAGRGTRAAIAAWEARHGMIADGHIDRTVLHSLGIG